jgi:hypothetical protein
VDIDTFHEEWLSTNAMNPGAAVLLAPAPMNNSIPKVVPKVKLFPRNRLIFGGIDHLDREVNSSNVPFSRKPFESRGLRLVGIRKIC